MTSDDDRVRVAIIFGGRSSEHDVSRLTATSVLQHIDRQKYDVIPIAIGRGGDWAVIDPSRSASGPVSEIMPLEVPGPRRDRREHGILDHFGAVVSPPSRPPAELDTVDVVFPLLHGPFGEDGTLQGLLALAEVRYVGAGVLTSAAMLDKQVMKMLFTQIGLRVGPYEVITDRDWLRDPRGCLQRAGTLGFPAFVKPARAGSSMGITKVGDESELHAAITAARVHDPKVIVEGAIIAREIECAVLEGRDLQPPRTSVLGEPVVDVEHDFYDFDAKYIDVDHISLRIPADLPAPIVAEIQRQSALVFEELNCEGLARIDFFYLPDGSVVINEVNTMPGFTPTSMFPALWEASGLSYRCLIDELIQLALARRIGLR